MNFRSLLPALPCAVAMAAPMAAHAHIALAETEARAGAYYVAAFRVGHGCDGKATTTVTVELPAGIEDAKNQPKAGWAFERQGRTAAWRGRLEDSQFEVFSILVKLPATSGPLYFPTVQTCDGAEVRWTEIPEPGQPWTSKPHPAPVVTLAGGAAATTPAPDAHAHH